MYIEVSYILTFNDEPFFIWEGAPKNGLIFYSEFARRARSGHSEKLSILYRLYTCQF